jgi:hypothetical protein
MVLFKPFPKQQEFIESALSGRYSYLMYGGAAGGGKTYVSMAIAIMLAKFYPGSRSFVVRESVPKLKKTSIKSFFKLCPKSFIKKYHQNDKLIVFKNGSELQFISENFANDKDLTHFDGLEGNFFFLEEGQELQEKTFNKAILRCGRNIIDPMPPKLIFITCNPSQNWTKQRFYMPHKNGELPDRYYYLRATMEDNSSLPQEYIESLSNLDDLTRAVFVNGDWDALDVNRPFAYAFKREKSIRAGLKLNNEHPIILSFDFNVDPITCLACQSYGESVRVLREFRLRNSDIFALCSEIKKYYQGKEFIVTGDASGANRSAMTKGAMNYYMIIKEELNVPRSNFKVPTFNPSIKNSRVLLNSMLEKYGDFYIDSSCEFLINDLLYVESDWAGNIDKTKDSSKTHLLDCLRYYLWTFHSNFVKYLKK